MIDFFEESANQIATNGYAVFQAPINEIDQQRLLQFAKDQCQKNNFKSAAIGKGTHKRQDGEIRNDRIHWIDDWEKVPFKPYSDVLSQLLLNFRQSLFLPLKRFEGHLAHYEPGSFYKTHVDRNSTMPNRLISIVFYLNTVEQGGALVFYKSKETTISVQPESGKMVLFDSQLPHAVLPTAVSRWTLTAWLRADI